LSARWVGIDGSSPCSIASAASTKASKSSRSENRTKDEALVLVPVSYDATRRVGRPVVEVVLEFDEHHLPKHHLPKRPGRGATDRHAAVARGLAERTDT
jgi:hypothetical protein